MGVNFVLNFEKTTTVRVRIVPMFFRGGGGGENRNEKKKASAAPKLLNHSPFPPHDKTRMRKGGSRDALNR